ncbi:LysE/ArgO family amino acid transporter [Bacillus sp. DTU_2020_1000418_1_SI_GHA_SEK_038]|uniref:LysE/ArgO family amino acid transporter n=1 Tax=Bacillus sp. DTU_2020_1000418_1_SI_GHA_SEK_038 TaxID=3077585 RepID=UPI0028E631C3|nr:LysE/ArgO family amino acid transporter [Bacillus sp. DTU_2020_1000418_1_SI_GHA_SEK_038]WNS76277.1 LysE/ArgO family amino acid transporter [Bacillus sp. DTU_2020_1000418_1_SI_GHA_SEK_038]
MAEAFIHGAILAFGLILPLGVQNVFIFNQGATQKQFVRALPAVITAGICDTLLILLAVMGVSIIVLNFIWIKNLLFIIGFFFLAYMGWSIWKSTTNMSDQQGGGSFSMKRQITFAASVSLLNPHAIMDTIGVIGTSSLAYLGYDKWAFAIACIGISWLWFFGLAIAGRKIGTFDTSGRFLKRMNQMSALIIWGMALYIGYQLFN